MKSFNKCLSEAVEEQNKWYGKRERKNPRSKPYDIVLIAIVLAFSIFVLEMLIFSMTIKELYVQKAKIEYPIEPEATYTTTYIQPQYIGNVEKEAIEPTKSHTFIVTHYCGCSICCGKWSSGDELEAYGCNGEKLTPYKSIATDPSVIPYGIEVYDEQGNTYIAQDTGSAIKGYRVDLFTGNHEEALQLGVKEIQLFW